MYSPGVMRDSIGEYLDDNLVMEARNRDGRLSFC
jgi:hypothetical protein